jgi:hypothetical protein
LPASEIVRLLECQVATFGRPVPRHEIESAVQNSLPCAWQPSQRPIQKPAAKWPSVNAKRREAIIRDGGGLADLWELSPVRIEDNCGQQHNQSDMNHEMPDQPQFTPQTKYKFYI